jgi:ketosteroid isomerase-like protein
MMQSDFNEQVFVESYIHAFEALDGHRVGAFYNVPCVTVRPDGSTHGFVQRNEIDGFFTTVLEMYANEGMTTFSAAAISVEHIGFSSCRFTCTWSMKRKDGSVIRDWQQTYVFQKSDDGWKIIASIFHL